MSATGQLSSLVPSETPSEVTIDFAKDGSVSEVTLKYDDPNGIQDPAYGSSDGHKAHHHRGHADCRGSDDGKNKTGYGSNTCSRGRPSSANAGASAPGSRTDSGCATKPGSDSKIKNAVADLLDALGFGGLADSLRGGNGKDGMPSGKSDTSAGNYDVPPGADSTPSDSYGAPSANADTPSEYATPSANDDTSSGDYSAPSGKVDTPSGADKTSSGSGGTVTVKEGQTLSDIAVANHTSVSQIMQANPEITDADKIKAGQTLKLPGTADKDNLPADLDRNAQTKPLSDEETKQRADKWVADLQKDLGLTKDQAVGVVANLCHESFGLNPGIQQGGKLGDPSMEGDVVNQTGYGICQWGEIRKQGLMDYAKQQGLPASSEAAQYGYFRQEFQYQYKKSLDAVKGSKSADDALQAFCTGFLVPSDPQLDQRKQWIGSDGSITVPSSRPHATT